MFKRPQPGATSSLSIVVFLALAIAGATGCTTFDSGSHFDETNDFGNYRSFSWIDDTPYISGQGQPAVSPLTQRKIENAIRSELEEKGYVFTPQRANADFVIAYTIGTRDELSVQSYPYPYRGAWGWHVFGSRYYVREYRQHSYRRGMLSVDIFDGEENKPVWHGWAEKTITESDREDPTETVNQAVTVALEDFPPGSMHQTAPDRPRPAR